jgi:predicted O-methyltransferase YrrM
LYIEEFDKHDLTGANAFPKVKQSLKGQRIDVLFIDSWHEYNQAKKDWEAYRPLLEKGALVICDDILKGTPGSGIDNMEKFWDEMDYNKFLNTNLHKGYPMGFFIYE